MKNTLGQNVAITLFGESHGEAIGAVVDGLAAGIKVDEEFIKSNLEDGECLGFIHYNQDVIDSDRSNLSPYD